MSEHRSRAQIVLHGVFTTLWTHDDQKIRLFSTWRYHREVTQHQGSARGTMKFGERIKSEEAACLSDGNRIAHILLSCQYGKGPKHLRLELNIKGIGKKYGDVSVRFCSFLTPVLICSRSATVMSTKIFQPRKEVGTKNVTVWPNKTGASYSRAELRHSDCCCLIYLL
jgi:hypothetical protein